MRPWRHTSLFCIGPWERFDTRVFVRPPRRRLSFGERSFRFDLQSALRATVDEYGPVRPGRNVPLSPTLVGLRPVGNNCEYLGCPAAALFTIRPLLYGNEDFPVEAEIDTVFNLATNVSVIGPLVDVDTQAGDQRLFLLEPASHFLRDDEERRDDEEVGLG